MPRDSTPHDREEADVDTQQEIGQVSKLPNIIVKFIVHNKGGGNTRNLACRLPVYHAHSIVVLHATLCPKIEQLLGHNHNDKHLSIFIGCNDCSCVSYFTFTVTILKTLSRLFRAHLSLPFSCCLHCLHFQLCVNQLHIQDLI